MLGTTALLLSLALQLPQGTGTIVAARVDSGAANGGTASAGPTHAAAVEATTPPVIDGRDDDPVWRTAQPIRDFVQWQPTEGKTPRFRTEAKVAFDASNLYVFVRAFDPHPDSITRVLERRDTRTASDMIWVLVDSYHDRRTGYEFGVNPAGVKEDEAIYNDGNEDQAWDAVWDVATRIDSLGWTAEYRIPLSQMRYTAGVADTFGLMFDRDIYRYSEREAWPAISQSKPGIVSQFGSLTGLTGLETPRRLEAVPYVVAKDAPLIVSNRFAQRSSTTVGGDLKYRIAANVTLDATVNPDFGQVEADPSVLNLTAYESFFDERRPFFVAGQGLFRFGVNCNQVNCQGEGLYYSRRIGRTPQLAGTYGDTTPLQPTTILGAAKLLGRFPSGLTVAMFDAATQRAASPGDTTFEPATNYAVIRTTQDLRRGATTFGGMLTLVNRHDDRWSAPYLASGAYAGGVDFRHRFLADQYEIAGSLDHSLVDGSAAAIAAIQTDAVHYYQRPDAGLPLDSTRTSLGGDAEELKFDKVGGQHLLFESAYQRRSAGFEINDLGYIRRADQQSWSTWVGWFDRHQRALYNRLQWNNNWWQHWTTDGLPLERAYNTNVHVTFRNNTSFHIGGTLGQLGGTYDDRAARGGPAVRQDPYFAPWLFVNGDDRRALVPSINGQYFRTSAGRSSSWSASPQLDWKAFHRFSAMLSGQWSRNIANDQWYGLLTDTLGATRYTFARMDQTTTSATLRLNYTFTPALSLQVYAQPFVSKGTFSDVRRLSATPRAAAYDARYAPFADSSTTNHPGAFDYKALQSNVVLRWEYRPGSTLFLIWNEGRQGTDALADTRNFPGDVRDLMRLHPANTFLVKASYWLNR